MVRIAVIDDEPLLLGLLAGALRSFGYDVTMFADPLSAYEASTTNSIPIDLIITDVTLKPITGFELIKRLRINNCCCPVIFMSGYHNLDAMATEPLEDALIMEKPFCSSELRSAISKLLTHKVPRIVSFSHEKRL